MLARRILLIVALFTVALAGPGFIQQVRSAPWGQWFGWMSANNLDVDDKMVTDEKKHGARAALEKQTRRIAKYGRAMSGATEDDGRLPGEAKNLKGQLVPEGQVSWLEGGVVRSLDRYQANRTWALFVLVFAPFAGFFSSTIYMMQERFEVVRGISEGGITLARAWLGIVAVFAVVLVFLTAANVWPALPIEFVAAPMVWLGGSAAFLVSMDRNAQVWNVTLGTLILVVVGMVATFVIQELHPGWVI